jgi:phosphoglycolate phosphatase-like HAD superfamily hydrolase
MHGAGRASFVRAFEQAFGWKDDLRRIRFAGATDLDLLHRLIREHGREPTPADEAAFFERLPVELERALAEPDRAPARAFPGVVELLERLGRRPDCLLGLVTGNIESCAWIKLRHLGLHTPFTLGAFGHEHGDRNEIARLALQRAERHHGGPFRRLFLIGDTPNDIRAAHAIGATAIAVATGGHPAAELHAAGADHVLEDLAGDAIDRVLGVHNALRAP